MKEEYEKLVDAVLAWYKWDEDVSQCGWDARNSGEWDDARANMIAIARHIKYGRSI